jgi:hypothetical protein
VADISVFKSFSAAALRCSVITDLRPPNLPLRRATSSAAFVRSRTSSRSIWAIAARMLNTRRPAVPDVSMPSVIERRPICLPSSSAARSTNPFIVRPKRSSFQTTIRGRLREGAESYAKDLGQRYSPVRLMCSHPNGETWASRSGAIWVPLAARVLTTSPSFMVFQNMMMAASRFIPAMR